MTVSCGQILRIFFCLGNDLVCSSSPKAYPEAKTPGQMTCSGSIPSIEKKEEEGERQEMIDIVSWNLWAYPGVLHVSNCSRKRRYTQEAIARREYKPTLGFLFDLGIQRPVDKLEVKTIWGMVSLWSPGYSCPFVHISYWDVWRSLQNSERPSPVISFIVYLFPMFNNHSKCSIWSCEKTT